MGAETVGVGDRTDGRGRQAPSDTALCRFETCIFKSLLVVHHGQGGCPRLGPGPRLPLNAFSSMYYCVAPAATSRSTRAQQGCKGQPGWRAGLHRPVAASWAVGWPCHFVQSNNWKPLLHSTTSARALPIRAPTTMRACSIRDASGNRVEYVWCGLLEAQRRVRRARCSQHTSSTATTCNCHATAAHRVCVTRSGLRANCSAA